MFSSIFGNLFLSKNAPSGKKQFVEASTQTSNLTTSSTQVDLDVESVTDRNVVDLSESMPLDWVIVDKIPVECQANEENILNETFEKPNKATVMTQSLLIESPLKTSGKVLKQNKKNKSGINAAKKVLNKENSDMKRLLLGQCFDEPSKFGFRSNNQANRMFRNKNAAFGSVVNSAGVNSRQRKFHNLQQPSFNSIHSQIN